MTYHLHRPILMSKDEMFRDPVVTGRGKLPLPMLLVPMETGVTFSEFNL